LLVGAGVLGSAAGIRVWVTSRSPEKREQALALGADRSFESGERLPERVDAVMETVGQATWQHSIRSLKPGGKLVVSGATSGQAPPAELKEAKIALWLDEPSFPLDREVLAGQGGASPTAADSLIAAEAVLAMAGPTNLLPEFNAHLRWMSSAGRVREIAPSSVADLRQVSAAGTAAARLRIVYGEHDWDDRVSAGLDRESFAR